MKLQSKILFVLVLLLVLGFIFLMPHGRYRHALEAYKQELIAKGEKLTIAELAPPPSTNASNGAKAFMDLMGNYKLPTNLPTAMRIVGPGLADVACTNLTSAQMLGYESNLSNVANLRDILSVSSVLDFNLDYSLGPNIPLPHLTKLKAAEQITAGTALQAYRARDNSEARADVLLGVNLVRLFPDDRLLISDLVRVALLQIAIKATWEGLQFGEWTDPQLAELQADWQAVEFFKNSRTTFAFERDLKIARIAEARQGRSNFVEELDFAAAYSNPAGAGKLFIFGNKLHEFYIRYPRYWEWKSSWSYNEELYLLQVFDTAQQLSRRAGATENFTAALHEFDRQTSNLDQLYPDRTNHFMTLFYGAGLYSRYLLKLAQAETARRLCVTAIALRRYYLQHGAHPATLDDLIPTFLSSVPTDFMDGKPLRYRLRPDGDFLLYSVGEDGQDDGGDPSPVPPATWIDWLTGRDIVWPRVATSAALEEYHRLSQSITNAPAK